MWTTGESPTPPQTIEPMLQKLRQAVGMDPSKAEPFFPSFASSALARSSHCVCADERIGPCMSQHPALGSQKRSADHYAVWNPHRGEAEDIQTLVHEPALYNFTSVQDRRTLCTAQSCLDSLRIRIEAQVNTELSPPAPKKTMHPIPNKHSFVLHQIDWVRQHIPVTGNNAYRSLAQRSPRLVA